METAHALVRVVPKFIYVLTKLGQNREVLVYGGRQNQGIIVETRPGCSQ